MIYQRRLFGAGISELAEEFGVSVDTVERRLRMAKDAGVPAHAREIVIRDMLPLAFAVAMDTMRQTDDRKLAFAAAKMVFEGLKVMDSPAGSGEGGNGDTDSYEVWRERIRVVRTERPGDSVQPAGGASVIDASPVPAGDSGETPPGSVPAPEPFPFRRAGWGSRPEAAQDQASPLPPRSLDGVETGREGD